MAISQKAICERPRVAAKPTQTVPNTKTTCVSTRSKRRNSFLRLALRASTSRSTTARFEGVALVESDICDSQTLRSGRVACHRLLQHLQERWQATLPNLRGISGSLVQADEL